MEVLQYLVELMSMGFEVSISSCKKDKYLISMAHPDTTSAKTYITDIAIKDPQSVIGKLSYLKSKLITRITNANIKAATKENIFTKLNKKPKKKKKEPKLDKLQEGYTRVEMLEVEAETGKAICIKFDSGKEWIPKAHCKVHPHHDVVDIKNWLYDKMFE